MFLEKNKKALDVELWAILKALKVVLKILSKKKILVIIFCNLQKALKTIQSTIFCNKSWFSRNLINYKTRKLKHNRHLIAIQ